MLTPKFLLLIIPVFYLKPFPSCLPRSWHPRWQVISRAVLALLLLNGLVIHVHVVLDRGHVLMP